MSDSEVIAHMLGKDNSSIAACSATILSSMMREIPFARSKGIDPDVYDMPFSEAQSYLDEYARDALEAYEPRVDVESVALEFGEGDAAEGIAAYTVAVVQSSLDDESDENYGDDG